MRKNSLGYILRKRKSDSNRERARDAGALARELGKLPNKISIEGHTDAKPFARDSNYGNWELSVDRANAARRLMQQTGVSADQVGQIRGYADQQLRKADSPEDPSNRRISLIIQYIVKDAGK